jgi:hypothetical protein
MKVLITKYSLRYPTRSKLPRLIIRLTLLSFALFMFQVQTHAFGLKIYENRTGITFDTQQPLAPQIEAAFLFQKENMSEVEFKRTMENLSDATAKIVGTCAGPFSELFSGLCDFSMSMMSVMCKAESAKDGIFECTNPGIDQYLRKQEITDPEANIRYFIEKANRGEIEDLFAGSLLGNMLSNSTS